MKRVLKLIQGLSLLLAIVTFVFFLLEIFPSKDKIPTGLAEEYDPSLGRLNNLKKITGYCDSIIHCALAANSSLNKDSLITNIGSWVIRERFYHGWAEYGVGNNYMSLALQPLMINKTVVTIVSIDDILKKPMAICGQQARILAAFIAGKGLPVRKVLFDHPAYGGHYALEVYYQGQWHFFDPDKEPDHAIAKKYDRPSLAFLQKNPAVLKEVYNHDDPKMIEALFSTGHAYPFEKVEGPNLLLYQHITYVLSFCSWFIFLIIYLWTRKINAGSERNKINKA